MPYQLAISVGAASSAAQPASRFTTSPCPTDTMATFTVTAAVTISLIASEDSLTRTTWSCTSRRYGRTSSRIRFGYDSMSWLEMSWAGAIASRSVSSSRLRS